MASMLSAFVNRILICAIVVYLVSTPPAKGEILKCINCRGPDACENPGDASNCEADDQVCYSSYNEDKLMSSYCKSPPEGIELGKCTKGDRGATSCYCNTPTVCKDGAGGGKGEAGSQQPIILLAIGSAVASYIAWAKTTDFN